MIPCFYYCWTCFLRKARFIVLPSAWPIMYLPLCFHNWLSLVFISSTFLANSVNAPWSVLFTQPWVVFVLNSGCIHLYFKSQSRSADKLFLRVIFFVKGFSLLFSVLISWLDSLHSVFSSCQLPSFFHGQELKRNYKTYHCTLSLKQMKKQW